MDLADVHLAEAEALPGGEMFGVEGEDPVAVRDGIEIEPHFPEEGGAAVPALGKSRVFGDEGVGHVEGAWIVIRLGGGNDQADFVEGVLAGGVVPKIPQRARRSCLWAERSTKFIAARLREERGPESISW